MYARNFEANHLQQARIVDIAAVAHLIEVLAGELLLEHQRYRRHPVHNVGNNQEDTNEGGGDKNALLAVRNLPDKQAQAKRKHRANQEPDEPDSVNQVRNRKVHEHGTQ